MATKAARVRTFTTSVDIPAEKRAKVVKILNQHLADSFDLQSQVKQAHWNVKGPDFWQLHKLFDEVAERAAEWVDELAERVTALAATRPERCAWPPAQAPCRSSRPTSPTAWTTCGRSPTASAAFTNSAREATDETDKLGDANTADLFTEISRCADKYLYFLEAHLQD